MLAAGPLGPCSATPVESPDGDEFGDEARGEAHEGVPAAASPVGSLRAHRSYWLVIMHQIGLICALTLSVIDSSYLLEWGPAKGPPALRWLRNHPSARKQAALVSSKVAEGVLAGTMVTCSRSELWCILPLGVAVNAAGKLLLIWNGGHVNFHPRKHKFWVETLQREGRALFERSAWGCTCDLSCAYHHVEMHPEVTRCPGLSGKADSTALSFSRSGSPTPSGYSPR